jgi:phage gpG-like protein
MIRITLNSNAARIVAGLKTIPNAMLETIAAAMDRENQFTIGHIARTKLSGRSPKTLGVISSRLRGSVRATSARVAGQRVTSSIGTNVKYAAVHEFGAEPYTIRPKNGKVLAWGNATGIHFAREVRHPGFPARAMFQTGVEERTPNYSTAISRAIVEAWEKQ